MSSALGGSELGRLPLSVCMIVKDEAQNLPMALASVKDWVQEMVVVDTGSSDGTQAIASGFGARVLEIAWQQDFAQARNVALDAARSEWILCLDADEFLLSGAREVLAAALRRPGLAQTVSIGLFAGVPEVLEGRVQGQCVSQFASLRLFRRDPRIRYRGRVHEDVSESLLEIGADDWPDSGLFVVDHGYGEAQARELKRARNLQLLELAHAEQPDQLFVAYKLAITLPASRQAQRHEVLMKALAQARSMEPSVLRSQAFMPRLLAAAIQSCVQRGRLVEAVDISQPFAALLGPLVAFSTGRAAARAGLWDQAVLQLQDFLDRGLGQQGGLILLDLEASEAQACRWLAWSARMRGELESARAWLERAMASAPPAQRMGVGCEGVRLDLAQGRIERAAAYLDVLAPLAQDSSLARAELMLVSAEVSQAAGDVVGAMALARAAMAGLDADHELVDAAAALSAMLEVQRLGAQEEMAESRVRELFDAVKGQRFDTLAVKWLLSRRLGVALELSVPQATLQLLEAA